MTRCTVDSCGSPVNARGLCHRHYRRWLTHGDPTVTLSRRMDGVTLAEKLAAYADRSGGPDACWPWSRGMDTNGYGVVAVPPADRDGGRTQEKASRAAWRVHHGRTIPPGYEILHVCDNPPCVNPAHLRLGTHAENMADMAAKRRSPWGERSARLKLTDADVAEARQMRADGALHREIAERFGVSLPYVSRLMRGERR